jgi:hypothetical protein
MEEINTQRRTLAERAGALIDSINAADTSAKAVASARAALDAKQVAAVVAGDANPPDLTAEREALAQLEGRHAILEHRAAIARAARDELTAKSAALLQNEYRPLQPALSPMIVDALVERMQSYAPALAEAERAYRAILRKTFLYACAIDAVSSTNRLGVFVGAERYTQHVPQLPIGEPFDRLCPNRLDSNADFLKLQTEAEQLIGKILRGADDETQAP